jgi:hypothetical protein
MQQESIFHNAGHCSGPGPSTMTANEVDALEQTDCDGFREEVEHSGPLLPSCQQSAYAASSLHELHKLRVNPALNSL